MLSYVAEQERKKNKQRQAEGIEVAQQKGIKFGRPKQEINAAFKAAYSCWKAGELTAVAAMKQTGMGRDTFYRRVKECEQTGAQWWASFLRTPHRELGSQTSEFAQK